MSEPIQLPSGMFVMLPVPINFIRHSQFTDTTVPIGILNNADIRALYAAMADEQIIRKNRSKKP